MSFMQPEVTFATNWVLVADPHEPGDNGSWIDEHDYIDGMGPIRDRLYGHGARLCAPWSLQDATEWTVHATMAEAAQHLLDTYYDLSDDASPDQLAEQAELLKTARDKSWDPSPSKKVIGAVSYVSRSRSTPSAPRINIDSSGLRKKLTHYSL